MRLAPHATSHFACLAATEDMPVLNREAESSSARSTHLRLQILSKFGSSAGLQPGRPDVDEQLRCASAARLTDAAALLMVPGNSWAAHTARRLLTTRSTPAMRGAAGQLYAEPPLQHFRRAYAVEVGEAQPRSNPRACAGNMPSAKRRKTAGSNPSANLQARRYAPATAAETISATAPAATTSTAPSASTTTASQQARPDVHSIVWAQCQGHAFWPGRVVAGATASLRVDFFGDNTTYAFKNAACVVPFCHERARQFEQAGRDQLDEDLRAKFVVACAAAAAAQRQLQGEQHSARSATQVRCGCATTGNLTA